MTDILSFYKNKRVLITGHTGFKGSWLSKILDILGADTIGYSLEPTDNQKLFGICKTDIKTVIGDIRDFNKLKTTFDNTKPQIVFHLAAQPIVLEGYENPRYTYETNVMGTVNLLECVRFADSVETVVNITTDKVYKNNEWIWGYRENDVLDGYDPYSNSKSCSELVTGSYRNAFLKNRKIPVSTARAGNVIGGGDFAKNRIIPDCIRAASKKETIIVRNPNSVRPYQHVLEPLYAYLQIAAAQHRDNKLEGSYNIGPDYEDCITTGSLADLFCKYWGEGAAWKPQYKEGNHEASFLKLDNTKIKDVLGFKPVYNIEKAVCKTVEWAKAYLNGGDGDALMERQIKEFLER